jgi:hypothetical protein
VSGDCFQVAFGLQLADDTLTLVHGCPIGRGPENGGRRFWHAWCERTALVQFPMPGSQPIEVVTVIDHDFDLPQAFYYQLGRLDPALTFRYTAAEAARLALRTRTYGPWVDAPCEVAG